MPVMKITIPDVPAASGTRAGAASPTNSDITAVSDSSPPATALPSPSEEHCRPSFDIESRPVITHPKPPCPPGPPGGWLAANMSRVREIAFNLTICMVQLIPQACLTTCFPILQILITDFNIQDPAILPWVVAAYTLSFGTTILLAGRLGDIFGHNNLVVFGFAWLSLFSVLAGLSRNSTYELFFVARAMQGLGSAMMTPNALALLGRSYPPNSRGKVIAFSAFGLCAPLGAYTGMLFSAMISQLGHWSWTFYVMAAVSVCLCIISAFTLPVTPKSPLQMQPFGKKLMQMDWFGGLTGVSSLVIVQVSLVSAPVQGWATQWVFMLLIIGVILLAFFITVQLFVSANPLVPFRLLNGNVAFVLTIVACGWGTFGVWTFYLWRFLLVIWEDTPLMAALHVLPIVPVAIFAAGLTAFLMRRVHPSWILFGALVAFTFGPTFLVANTTTSTYWSFTFISLIVTPFGMDMSFPAATFIMSNSLPMDKQGVAGSLVSTIVYYSISLGLGLASTVEVHANSGGQNVMTGIHYGWVFGVGLGGVGVIIAAVFVVKSLIHPTPIVAPKSLPATQPDIPLREFKEQRRRSGAFSSTTSTIAEQIEEEEQKLKPVRSSTSFTRNTNIPKVPPIPRQYLR